MAKEMKLNKHAFGLALGGVTLLWGLLGLLWHGPMGQPTMMGLMYSGFNWITMFGFVMWGAVTFLAYVTGYAFAWLYNWALKL